MKIKHVLCDGAFGTYYQLLTKSKTLPEQANKKHPEIVKQIHKEYMKAGARLIRTNTFAVNTVTLNCQLEALVEEIKRGYFLAKEAVQEIIEEKLEDKVLLKDKEKLEVKAMSEIQIAGDIGPISNGGQTIEALKEEYLLIGNTFLDLGVETLVFETFPDLEMIKEVIQTLKQKKPTLFIIVQFCVNQYGYSASGISAKKLLETASRIKEIDAVGFNCGVGPEHLYQILKKLNLKCGKYITALPNASYPKRYQDRMVFLQNKTYFAEQMKEIAALGVHFIGGCCGTTPEYIQAIHEQFEQLSLPQEIIQQKIEAKEELEVKENINLKSSVKVRQPSFFEDKPKGEKILAVELSPPPDIHTDSIMDAAHLLKQRGVDIITFPDSPSGRTRADSILMAVKVLHEVDIKVLPHICCRDRNAIALRSALLGAHINGIREALIITGDPVPMLSRESIKSVFNFNAIGVMKLLEEMNQDSFQTEPICYGGGLNYNRRNIEVEIQRLKKKEAAGATFFLTQPVFTKEDVDKLRYIKSHLQAKVLCGIMPLISRRNARFIQNEMSDIHVTDEIVELFSPNMTKEEGEAVGVRIAKEMIQEAQDFVEGYYFSIPFNRVYLLEQILPKEV